MAGCRSGMRPLPLIDTFQARGDFARYSEGNRATAPLLWHVPPVGGRTGWHRLRERGQFEVRKFPGTPAQPAAYWGVADRAVAPIVRIVATSANMAGVLAMSKSGVVAIRLVMGALTVTRVPVRK